MVKTVFSRMNLTSIFLEFFDELDKGNKSYKNRIWKLYVLEKSIQKYKNL